jgi:ribonuclease-3
MTLPPMPETSALEAAVGVTFTDRALLRLALTHRSATAEPTRGKKAPKATKPPTDATKTSLPPTNERLEFLGDAVLAYVTADFLYRTFPHLTEGELTAVRSALVKAPTLATFAQQLQLGAYLIMGRGEAMTGGRDREPLLAAAFEALLGALTLDQGLEVAAAFVLKMITTEAHLVVEQRRFKDAKTILQERVQGRLAQTPTYHVLAEEGPSHQRTYTVEVRIGDLVAGQGTGSSKQRAEQNAARDALSHPDWQDAPTTAVDPPSQIE